MTSVNQTSTRSRVITHIPLVVVASNGVNKSELSFDIRWFYLNGATPQLSGVKGNSNSYVLLDEMLLRSINSSTAVLNTWTLEKVVYLIILFN